MNELELSNANFDGQFPRCHKTYAAIVICDGKTSFGRKSVVILHPPQERMSVDQRVHGR
jgi:hypothetical protein